MRAACLYSQHSETKAARNSQVRGQFGLQSIFSQLGYKDPVFLQKKKGKKKINGHASVSWVNDLHHSALGTYPRIWPLVSLPQLPKKPRCFQQPSPFSSSSSLLSHFLLPAACPMLTRPGVNLESSQISLPGSPLIFRGSGPL